jgi:hypothetical protein
MDSKTKRTYNLWQLVENGRIQRGITKKELYRGIQISLKHQIADRDADNFDKLTWDYLLSRLGISNLVYEGYVYGYEFDLYQLHMELREVTNRLLYLRYQKGLGEEISLTEVGDLLQRGTKALEDYEEVLHSEAASVTVSGMLHSLFQKKMEGYLLIGQELADGHSYIKERRELAQEAWALFHEGNCLEAATLRLSKHQLAPSELECLMQSAAVLMDEDRNREAEQILAKVWAYRTHHELDLEEEVKLYPYVAWLLAAAKRRGGRPGATGVLEQGLELLIRSGKMNGLMLILEGLLQAPDYGGDRALLQQQRDALKDVTDFMGENIYGIYPLFTMEHMIHVNDLVRQKRREQELTQQQLCDGIISWEWYCKFEREHYSPSWEKTSVLLMELGMPYARQWLVLDTDQPEVMRAYIKCKGFIRKNQYELMDDQFHWVKVAMDQDSVVNRQYIAHMEGIIEEEIYAKDYPGKCASFYEQVLAQSIPGFPDVDYSRLLLSEVELRVLLDYVFALGDGKKALEILEQVIEGLEKRKVTKVCKGSTHMTYFENLQAFEGTYHLSKSAMKKARINMRYALVKGEMRGVYSELVGYIGDISDAYPKSITMKNACDSLYAHALVLAQLERSTFWIRIINSYHL